MSDHDREWIIGCIKHDGFIKTDRFDKANHIILDALEKDIDAEIARLSRPTDLISRADAICEVLVNDGIENIVDRINALPSDEAEQTDYTELIEWLTEVVMDEENWELNAVAYGEVICRKLVKLGVLEVTEEPSYYIRPSAEAVHGEWIMHGEPPWYVRECSKCGTKWHQWSGDSNPNYCGNCGARMKGEVEE